MDLMLRRRELLKMGGGLLPPGYRQLSYITGNGAYIDTGLMTSLPFTYECEMRWESFGTRQSFGANGGSFFGVKADGMWQCGHAGTQSTGVQALTGQWYNVRFYKEDREQSTKPTYLEVDGIQIGSTKPTYTVNEICVFSSTRGANIATNASVKWYKVWIGNTLERHFIPCINPNNVVGMYDIINRQFYGSANSANFIGQ